MTIDKMLASDLYEMADEDNGHVEAPTGFFATVHIDEEMHDLKPGRYLLVTDNYGFDSIYEDSDGLLWDERLKQYCEWYDED